MAVTDIRELVISQPAPDQAGDCLDNQGQAQLEGVRACPARRIVSVMAVHRIGGWHVNDH